MLHGTHAILCAWLKRPSAASTAQQITTVFKRGGALCVEGHAGQVLRRGEPGCTLVVWAAYTHMPKTSTCMDASAGVHAQFAARIRHRRPWQGR